MELMTFGQAGVYREKATMRVKAERTDLTFRPTGLTLIIPVRNSTKVPLTDIGKRVRLTVFCLTS